MGLVDTIKGAFRLSNKSYTETTTRPSIAQPYMSTDTGAKLPIFPFPLIMIYELAENIDALRIPIETINREMFKNGFEIVERFKYKCNNCSKEFQYAPNVKVAGEKKEDMKKIQCDSCQSYDLRRPIPEHRKTVEKLMSSPVNGNNQSLEDVARQLERDLEIADNAYLLLLKNYFIDDTTGMIDEDKTEIKELLRVDPPQVAMIADSDGRIGYDDKRQKIWVCPRFEHRDKRLYTERCDRCNAKGIKAIMEVNSVYSIGVPHPKRVIYGEGEVIWKAGKYRPSLIYGYSPIYAVWSKAMSLSHMDEYVRKYFDKMRPPRGLLVIASRNYETFRKSWDALEQKAIEDPYMIHPLMVESDKGGKNMANWIDFTGSLKELEFIEVRKELRQVIGAVFGVLPLYYGEMVGGWSQEGLQVTITNRAVKWGQDILFKAFLKKFIEIMGIDDWDLKLVQGEENDKLAELQRDGVEIQNVAMLQQMGFEISRTHTGDFDVSKEPTKYDEIMGLTGEGGINGRGRSTASPVEERQAFSGAPAQNRPSDIGGIAQGSPSTGGGTSMSQKSFPDGITPSNFTVVKNTLQTAVDFGWKKTKTVDKLRESTGMTVRQARDIVKAEFEGMRQWEEIEKKETINKSKKEENEDDDE
jgi:DNA-directed RNA polymerase subunit RPC12/RpoP